MGNQASFLPLADDDPVTKKTTERGDSNEQQIQFAVSGMRGLRSSMEDHHLYYTNIPVPGAYDNALKDHSVFAVFDGHGGGFTSQYLKKELMSVFVNRPEMAKYAFLPKTGQKSRSDVNGVQYLKQALIGTFLELDRKLGPLQQERTKIIQASKIKLVPESDSDEDDEGDKEETHSQQENNEVSAERSGSTGIVVILTPTHIICANTGDSRALLRRDGEVLPLSFDHKPSNLCERVRITGANGVVKSKRVDGDLAVSRAFGDFMFKENDSLSVDKQKVIVVPDLIVHTRMEDTDEFIILACDGVWDVATSRECSDFVQTLLSEGETDLGNIAEEALDICLERHSSDNMTMMMVALPGIKADSSSTAAMKNAVWGQRSTRKAVRAQAQAAGVSNKAAELAQRAFLHLADY